MAVIFIFSPKTEDFAISQNPDNKGKAMTSRKVNIGHKRPYIKGLIALYPGLIATIFIFTAVQSAGGNGFYNCN